ncbi:MAG: ABC transporter ATP-binding protein [Opitutaceae bacterium]
MSETAEIVLRAHALEKSFPSGPRMIEVLRGIDLTVRTSESVSIRGESGSGKTTLLNLLAGLELPDKGTLAWAGEEVGRWPLDRIATLRGRFIGMVFQNFYLVPEIDALENVLLAARIAGRAGKDDRERARSLMARVGLAERTHHLPGKLSGGERQRVALARALINGPRLVLADEPTGNLDERTGNVVMDQLLELCRDERVALLLVTHNKAHAARTTRQTFLHLGKLEAGSRGQGTGDRSQMSDRSP